jgi:hypothetical protein
MYKCNICNKEFTKAAALGGHKASHNPERKRNYILLVKANNIKKEKCIVAYTDQPFVCEFCHLEIPYAKAIKNRSDLKRKSKRTFCNSSCAASYNNTHKATGTRVSKLEKWMAEKLDIIYPSLEIHYNRKDAINSELDIYIPALKLAIELYGIFHYEPIFS